MNILGNMLNNFGGGGNQQGGRVMVNVLEARNLARKDLFSKSDPYCEVSIVHKHSFSLLGSTQKTTTINNNQNPMWNQTFALNVTNPDTELLKIKCWDNDPMSFDDVIGEVDIPLFGLHNGMPKDDWYQLFPAKGGSIHLIITAQGFGLPGGPPAGMPYGGGMPGQWGAGFPPGGPYPQMGGGYPQAGGYPPQQMGGYPPQQMGGYPPQQMGGYPPQMGGGGYPPQPGYY